MSLFACGNIHHGHERLSEVFMCLAALLCEQFLLIREWRRQDIDQVLLHGDHFFLSAFRSSEVPGKHASMSKLPTSACWSREKREEAVKLTCFVSKATSVRQANHSQFSSPVEALNSMVESKSPPVEVKIQQVIFNRVVS